VSIAVFGGVCGNKVLPLFVLAGSLKGETYRDILSLLSLPVLQEKLGLVAKVHTFFLGVAYIFELARQK